MILFTCDGGTPGATPTLADAPPAGDTAPIQVMVGAGTTLTILWLARHLTRTTS